MVWCEGGLQEQRKRFYTGKGERGHTAHGHTHDDSAAHQRPLQRRGQDVHRTYPRRGRPCAHGYRDKLAHPCHHRGVFRPVGRGRRVALLHSEGQRRRRAGRRDNGLLADAAAHLLRRTHRRGADIPEAAPLPLRRERDHISLRRELHPHLHRRDGVRHAEPRHELLYKRAGLFAHGHVHGRDRRGGKYNS